MALLIVVSEAGSHYIVGLKFMVLLPEAPTSWPTMSAYTFIPHEGSGWRLTGDVTPSGLCSHQGPFSSQFEHWILARGGGGTPFHSWLVPL